MGKRGQKFWIWTGGTIAFLIVASIVGWFVIKKDLSKPNSIVEKKVGELFKEMIIEASDSLYKVAYTKFDIDLASGKGIITNLKLTPDTAVLRRLKQTGRVPNNVIDISIKSFLIAKLRYTKTNGGRKLEIQNIIIQEPTIKVTNKLNANRINGTKKKDSELLSLVKTFLKLSEVKTITVKKFNLIYVNDNDQTSRRTNLKDLNMDLTGLTAVENNQNGAKRMEIRVLKNRVATPDSLYYINMEDFRFIPQQATVVARLAELRPRLSKAAFFRSVKWAKDRIVIVYRDLSMKHINLNELVDKQQIHIGAMESSASFTEVYTDYNWPRRDPRVRQNPFPHQQLKKLAFDITIDTMKLKNSDMHWRVLADHSDHVSSLDFLKSHGTILNITNNKDKILQEPHTTVNMHCVFNNAAPMHLKMNLNLADKDGAFTASSVMGRMNATFLNGFSEPFAMIGVKQGTINRMDLQLKADDNGGTGNVDLYYTGLKVAMLKEDKQTGNLKPRKLVSILSNAMLPNDNPAKNGKFKKGPINVKREANQSFFGFLSKCMLDGMTSAMTGLEQNKKKEDSNIIIKVGRAIIGNPVKKQKNK